MSSTRKTARHRSSPARGRHRQPPRPAGGAGPAAATVLAAGALGSAAMMALPAGAAVAAAGQPAATAASPAVVLTAEALPPSAAAASSPAPGPGAGTFGAGAQPVQLFDHLVPVAPSVLDQLRTIIANGSGTASISGYPLGIFGGSLALTLGADGGALSVGAGVGVGGSVKISASDAPPSASLSAQIVGQASADLDTPAGTSLLSGSAQVNFNIFSPGRSSATGQLAVGPVQFSQTTPLGGSAAAGPNAGDQASAGAGTQTAAFRAVGFGSGAGIQAVGVIPFTYEGLVHDLALIGGTEAGLTVDQIFPPPTPQQVIDGDFAQLAGSPYQVLRGTMPALPAPVALAVPYLGISTPGGLLDPATGGIITTGGPASALTGLPDPAGSSLLPGQLAAPPTPAAANSSPDPSPDPGAQPYYDPLTGIRLSGPDPAASAAASEAVVTTAAAAQAAAPAQVMAQTPADTSAPGADAAAPPALTAGADQAAPDEAPAAAPAFVAADPSAGSDPAPATFAAASGSPDAA